MSQSKIEGAEMKGSSKEKGVRRGNIAAARAVADVVRTSLGPRGMDKMISGASGEVTITNDGATIMQKMQVQAPAAKMLIDLSKSQDVEAGDGTTSVVVLAGSMLEQVQRLLDRGVHPTVIADAWKKAAAKSEKILESMSLSVDMDNRDALVQSAITSLSSKVVSSHSHLLAPIAVDAVTRIMASKDDHVVDLDDIRVVNKVGKTVEETELIDGVVFTQKATTIAGGPSRITDAKIGLIQFQLSAPKTDMDNSIVVQNSQQLDRLLREERRYIMKRLKPIIKSGCNVLLIQKSILRDAVNDLALHFLAKKGIMLIKDVERSEIEFLSKSLGCLPVAEPDGFTAAKLGAAKLAEEMQTMSGRIVKITGVKNPGKTVSVLVRGSNQLVCDEAERSLHDALCVIRCLVKKRFLLPGGGAPEIEVAHQLRRQADQESGADAYCLRAFAQALEVIPYTLAENAGLHPIKIVTQLLKAHAAGEKYAGLDIKRRSVSDILKLNIVQPLLVSTSAINLSAEVVRQILKIDDIVLARG